MKDIKPGETLYQRINEDPVQFFNMKALGMLGRAAYVIKVQKEMLIIPSKIFASGNVTDMWISHNMRHMDELPEGLTWATWNFPIKTHYKNSQLLLLIVRMPSL